MTDIPAQIGPYQVVREIGRGGMGVVYLARDERLGREVAIKCLPDDFAADAERLERFDREARLLASLNHPNIATVHGLEEVDGKKYLVLEYIDGESLTDYLRQQGPSWRKCLEVASGIADALAAAHARGVAHRDVKPDNVRFTRDGRVKVLDFGLACTVPQDGSGGTDATTVARDTKPGAVMGTPGYMAPEQARGQPADARSDIFAFGCLLYEMLTGREAFGRDTVADSLAATLQQDVDPPSRIAARIPSELDAIVMRCLEKRPDDRFQSARDLAFSLRTVIGGQDPSSRPGPPPPAGSRRPRRPWLIGAGLASIAIVALSVWQLRPGPPASPAPRSLAVLPFVDKGEGEDLAFLCDGIAESITNRLQAALPELVIAPRALAFQFRGPDVDLDEVARSLNVEVVVTGRVMQQGDRLIVRPELTDIADRRHLWGEPFPFNEKMTDILHVEETIATQIAEALMPELSGQQRLQLARSDTEDSEAYLAYLNGRFWWRQHWPEANRKALPYFEDAIAADPDFALAYAGIADVHSTKSGFPADESRRKARAAIREAMRLNDSLAEVQTAQGLVNMIHEWNWEAAERSFQRALDINPNFGWAHHVYGHLLSVLYRYDEARAHFERALELEPRNTDNYVCLGGQYLRMGLYDEVEGVLTKPQARDTRFGLELSADVLGWSHLRRERFDEAIAVFEQAVEASNRGWYALSLLATGEAVRGNEVRARALLDELLRRPRPPNAGDEFLAPIYAALGEDDEALQILERVYESRENIWFAGELLRPGFDSLLENPRFQSLLHRMNIPPRASVAASLRRGPPRLVVLPFENSDATGELTYLADEIPACVIDSLAGLSGVHTIPRSTAFRYRDGPDNAREIGRRLDADYVLVGRIVRRGDHLRVRAELIAVATNRQQWSRPFDHPLADTLALETEVTKQIVDALQVQITGEERMRLQQRRPNDTSAHLAYLKGRFWYARRSSEGLLRAIKAFDEAIALDSSFALAYAGKASAYRTLGALYQSAEEMYPLARDAVEEALAIDESLAEAYSELGRIRFTFEYDLPGARSAFERAVSLKEHDGEIRRAYGHALIPVDLEVALRQFEAARRLDPESVLVANCYGHTLDWAGETDDAMAEFDRAKQIDPANPVTRVYRAHSLMRQGLFDEAIHEIQLTEEMLTYFFPYMAGDLGCAHALAGREQKAREQLRVLEERARQGEYVPHLAFAKIYAGLGQVDDAVDELERAFEAREYIIFIGDWPHFEKVRQDPRFLGLLKRMGVQRWASASP